MSREQSATVQSIYLCRASGEGTAEVRLCRSLSEVKSFYEEMFGPEGIDDAMKDFQDDDHWCNDGHHEQLYCADWEAWRVPADFAIRADLETPSIQSATEQYFKAPCPLPQELVAALIYYDKVTADASVTDTEWDFVMTAQDWREIRGFFSKLKPGGPPKEIINPPKGWTP